MVLTRVTLAKRNRILKLGYYNCYLLLILRLYTMKERINNLFFDSFLLVLSNQLNGVSSIDSSLLVLSVFLSAIIRSVVQVVNSLNSILLDFARVTLGTLKTASYELTAVVKLVFVVMTTRVTLANLFHNVGFIPMNKVRVNLLMWLKMNTGVRKLQPLFFI